MGADAVAEMVQYDVGYIKTVWTQYFKGGVAALLTKPRGGRRRENMSREEKAALLAAHAESAKDGKLLKIAPLHCASVRSTARSDLRPGRRNAVFQMHAFYWNPYDRAARTPSMNTNYPPKITVADLNLFYGSKQALYDVAMQIAEHQVTALIGPSGCGKSTFLRCLNRMNDTIQGCRITGQVKLAGQDIYAAGQDPVLLRSRIGMVFQKPNPFPKSIYDNVAYGPRLHGLTKDKTELDAMVEGCLRKAGLWEEVKDRLKDSGTGLSGGQQQRLCIARAIAVNPEVILMDEPCSALDPIATAKVEELIADLQEHYTIVIVTHSMQQAARVSQQTAFFHLGKVVEFDTTENIFDRAQHQQTRDYIEGRYG